MNRLQTWLAGKKITRAGFSLVELLVAVSVTALLLAAVFGVLATSILSFQNTADQGANVQISRDTLNRISGEIRNATAIQAPSFTNGTATVGTILNYTSPEVGSPNRRITMGNGADANNILIINRDNGAVIQRIGQNRVRAASLSFSRSGADQRVFTVSLIFQSNAFGGSIDTPVSTVVTTLNSGT
jgi:prepilin-type N-terminal cleavage/methylation domain-containing protein